MKEWIYIVKNHKRKIIAIMLLRSIGTLFEGISFSFFIPLLYSLSLKSDVNINFPAFLEKIFIPLMNIPSEKRIYIIFSILLIGLIIKNILTYYATVLNSKLQFGVLTELKYKIFIKYFRLPYSYIVNNEHGKLIHTINDDASSISTGAFLFISEIGKILNITIMYILMLIISWKLTLLTTISFLILSVGINKFSKISQKMGYEKVNITREESGFLSNSLQGMRQVLIFRAENRLIAHYKKLNYVIAIKLHNLAKIKTLISPLIEISALLITSFLLIVITYFNLLNIQFQAPLIITFLAIIGRLLPTVNYLSQEHILLKSYTENVQHVLNLLKEPEIINEGSVKFEELKNKISFSNVDFAHKPGIPVLKNITIFFLKNKTTAIVGHSGSGKSTIIDLIVGLFQPTKGSIFVDKTDLKNLDLNSWRKKIGYVTQDTFIFHGSVKENILFGNPEADENHIIEAAKQADAHQFIIGLPEQYNTIVGERGLKLSGGQRQRIAIARALLINPEILIFDEATSSLDSYSENAILESINKISRNKTVIIVAHRLSTIINADKIIVLKNGSIVEEGNHNELIKNKGEYSKLYKKANK